MASGPSLTEEVIESIRPHKDRFVIFGCNDVYKVVDYLDIHYACDTAWWTTWAEHVKELRPELESWTQCKPSAEKFKVNHIPGKYSVGLSLDSSLIHFGSNSGFQQLNLAFLMGCSEFFLVGYDMRRFGGKSHFFGEHPTNLKRNSPYEKFVSAFSEIQQPIKDLVTNCTPDSAIKCFKEKSLEKVLEL